eukprot:5364200-Amphidinium_carterae.1
MARPEVKTTIAVHSSSRDNVIQGRIVLIVSVRIVPSIVIGLSFAGGTVMGTSHLPKPYASSPLDSKPLPAPQAL